MKLIYNAQIKEPVKTSLEDFAKKWNLNILML
jgi:hypothetical protein